MDSQTDVAVDKEHEKIIVTLDSNKDTDFGEDADPSEETTETASETEL